MSNITVMVNGNRIDTDKTNVMALLDDLNLTTGRFAVEIDNMLIPKSRLADTPLTSDLKIEVVQAVGGG